MTRRRNNHIKVFVTKEERAEIDRRAKAANLSLSAYLRTAGLNRKTVSIFDVKAVIELSKINGELWKRAELLKLCPPEMPRAGEVIEEIRELQTKIHDAMGKVLR